MKTLKEKRVIDLVHGCYVYPEVHVAKFLEDLKDMIVRHYSLNNRTKQRLSILKRINKLSGFDQVGSEEYHSPIQGCLDKEPSTRREGSDNQGCGKWFIDHCGLGGSCGEYGLCPKCQKARPNVCECGHSGGMHGDGEYTHTGECVWQLNDEKNDAKKMEFCKCKKYKQKEDEK